MLNCPTEHDISSGSVTDHCCTLSLEVLRRLKIADRIVTLEAHVRRFPAGIHAGIFYGLPDALRILGDRNVKLWAMPPGSVFHEGEPVLVIEGSAENLAMVRPAITGALTFGSSLVTRACNLVRAATPRPVFFFGSRKLHPAHVRQYLECAYVAGMEVNVTPQAAQIIPEARLEDCQEHYANLIADRPEDAWREFVHLPDESGAIFIVLDNLDDPAAEAERAVLLLKHDLKGILIDTDTSRRGDIRRIVAEVAWRLKVHGREDVRIALTGGVTPEVMRDTKAQIASYGVGLSTLVAPLFDFALQVVAVDGVPKSKIGVPSGKKTVLICQTCDRREVTLFDDHMECCGHQMVSGLPEVQKGDVYDHSATRGRIKDLAL